MANRFFSRPIDQTTPASLILAEFYAFYKP